MITASILLLAIAKHEPDLTNWTLEQRKGANKESVRAASIASLCICAIAFLNSFGALPKKVRDEIDLLVDRLPDLMSNELVRLDHAILDMELLQRARNEILGANSTGGKTAVGLIYNVRVSGDTAKILSMTNGPLGEVGGMAVVVGDAMRGEESNEMLELVEIISLFNQSLIPKESAGSLGTQAVGKGCAVAALGISFVFAASLISFAYAAINFAK